LARFSRIEPELSITIPHRDGDVFVMKGDDVCTLPSSNIVKADLIQIGDDVLFVVNHWRMQQDLVHIFCEDKDSAVTVL